MICKERGFAGADGMICGMDIPAAIGRFGPSGELVWANGRWAALFGDGDAAASAVRRRLGAASEFEFASGSVRAAVSLQKQADGGYVACAHDISRYPGVSGRTGLGIDGAVISRAPFVMTLWDEGHNLLEASDYLVKIFELDDKSEYETDFLRFSPEYQPCGGKSADMVGQVLDRAFAEGSFTFEWMHCTANGRPLPMEIHAARFEHDGRPLVAAYSKDLRGTKALLENEKKSLDLARQFLNKAPIFIETWDSDLNLTGTNEAAVKMFGLRDREHYLEVYKQLHPEFQPCGTRTVDKIPQVVEAVMRDGYAEGEWMHQDLAGNPVPVFSTYVRFDLDGGQFYIVGYSQDLRPIRAAMAELESALRLNQDLINSAPLFIEIWNEELEIIECNDAAAKMFGVQHEGTSKRLLGDLSPEFQPCGTPSAEFGRRYVAKAFEEGHAHAEYVHKDAAGRPFPVDVTFVRMHRGGRDVVVSYNVDMRPNRAASEMTQELLDAAPFFVEVWSRDGELIGCSNAAVKTFGLSNKDEYLSNFASLCPAYQPCGKTSEEALGEMLARAFEEGYARHEWIHLDKEGNLWPFDVIYVRMPRWDDDIVVAYATDLRPIKNAMDEVKKAMELSQMYLDAAPFFVEIWDCEMNLKSCNEAAAKLFGFADTHDYVRLFDKLSPPLQPCGTPSGIKIRQIVGKAVEEGYSRSEWTHLGIDGQPFQVDVVYVRLSHGAEDVIVGYNQDLRPLRIAMDRLKVSEERSKILLDASPTPSIIFDEGIVAVDTNFAALSLFAVESGRRPAQTYPLSPELEVCSYEECVQFHKCGRETCPLRAFLLERHCEIFACGGAGPDAARAEMHGNCLDVVQNGTKKFERALSTLYGETVPCEITIVSVNYNDSQGFAFYIRDLREEKLRAMAEDASRAKSSFLSTISHEIRTPLNAILGITEIRLMDKNIAGGIRDDLMKIYSSSDVLLKIINDILDLSKIEAGKLSIVTKEYEVASLISDTVQLNILRLGSKPVEFKMRVDDCLPTHALGDELRVKQILSNLLSNAFKYTERGEVALDVGMKEAEDNTQFVLEITVTDTGVGMTKEQVDAIFDEFTRFYESGTGAEGTGLGMSITQNLVGLMGGGLTVESEVGRGSVFSVTLPQGRVPGAGAVGRELAGNLEQFRSIGVRAAPEDIVREPMPYGRILVVDDVEVNIYVVMGLLVPYGLQVDEASSGREAIEKIRQGNEYDIVFMDHMMPEMDGIEATKTIREMGYKKPVVALTANAVAGQSDMFLRSGFDDFISKPINVRSMNAILNKFVRDARARADDGPGVPEPGGN